MKFVRTALTRAQRPASSSVRGSSSGPLVAALVFYVVLGLIVTLGAAVRGRNLLVTAAYVPASPLAACGANVVLGGTVAALTIVATRRGVMHSEGLRALHTALRPAVVGADDALLWSLAIASGTAEELLFRGVLVPWVGVWCSSVLFGLIHQVHGRGRWTWVAWATGLGLVFALIYRVTGSLVGPIIAHVVTNGFNLRYLRDVDPAPKPRRLGGLLGDAPDR